MNTTLLKLTILIGALSPVIPADALAQERDELSVLAYCQAGGGTLTDTEYRHISVCCYERGQKCILHNEQRRYSLRMANTPGERDLQIAREAAGGRR